MKPWILHQVHVRCLKGGLESFRSKGGPERAVAGSGAPRYECESSLSRGGSRVSSLQRDKGALLAAQRRSAACCTEEERCLLHKGGAQRAAQRRSPARCTEEERCVLHRREAQRGWFARWVSRMREITMKPHRQRHKHAEGEKNIDTHSQWQWLVGWLVCVCDGRGRRCGHRYRLFYFYLWPRRTSVLCGHRILVGWALAQREWWALCCSVVV
jgi:hypothetical protein